MEMFFMSSKDIYSRKISKSEADNNFIFILKNELSFFPPLGQDFVIKSDDLSCTVKVESYPCTCRGPDLPHEHYFIKWKGLEAKNRVEIKKNKSENNEYTIKIFF
jgi:hypothetical protein